MLDIRILVTKSLELTRLRCLCTVHVKLWHCMHVRQAVDCEAGFCLLLLTFGVALFPLMLPFRFLLVCVRAGAAPMLAQALLHIHSQSN